MKTKKIFSVVLSSLLVLLSLPYCAFAASTVNAIFVATDGDDSAEGTFLNPLATLEAAKNKAKSISGDVTVYFREGSYTLTDTVEFDSTDKSGVTYRAYRNEKVIFTAGTPYTGFEECTVNGVKAFRKAVGRSADFNVLFNENTTLNRTRYPETGYLYVKSTSEDDLNNPGVTESVHRSYRAMTVNSGDVPEMKNYEDVVIRILHYWKDEMLTVKSYDAHTGYMEFSRPSSMNVQEGDRYFLENVFEALNAPGEWYLDRNECVLYYIPFDGEDAATLTLWGSETETLININGVDGISFENIIFRGNGFNIPRNNREQDLSSQAAYDATPCVACANAVGFTVKNCEFRDIAACAVFLGTAVRDARVENCYFNNLGAQAVYIRGNNVQPDDEGITKDITITNNTISSYGRVFFNAVGILIIHANSVEVSHNEIHDGYYTAISCGWVWGYAYSVTYNCKITDNLIYDIGQGWLSDMGGIYMLGVQPGTVISGNVIHNVAADPGQGGYGGWGIYLDEGSSHMLVENNLSFACGNDAYHLHYGSDNTVRNNIFALSGESQVRVVSRYEGHLTAEFSNNIILTDGETPLFSYIQADDCASIHDNILWNISDSSKLYVTDGDMDKAMKLKTAARKDLIGENTVADPGFINAENFDFGISDSSVIDANGFSAWDYQNAGTLKNTVIGLDITGGQTAYNSGAKQQELKNADLFFPVINDVLNIIVNVFNKILKLLGLSVSC